MFNIALLFTSSFGTFASSCTISLGFSSCIDSLNCSLYLLIGLLFNVSVRTELFALMFVSGILETLFKVLIDLLVDLVISVSSSI